MFNRKQQQKSSNKYRKRTRYYQMMKKERFTTEDLKSKHIEEGKDIRTVITFLKMIVTMILTNSLGFHILYSGKI